MRLDLLAACLISIGSHFAWHILPPLRPTFGDAPHFAALMSSVELVNTITPLVAGFMIPRIGASRAAVAATLCVVAGQMICYVARPYNSFLLLRIGFIVSGMAVAPLSTVQESVVLSLPAEGRAFVLGVTLMAGKGTSFLAAITAVPLHESLGILAPYVCSLGLALLSFGAALVFYHYDNTHRPQDGIDHTRAITMREVVRLGDATLVYLIVCALCGSIWFTITHESPDFVHVLYGSSSRSSANVGSITLVAGFFGYPVLGRLIDKQQSSPQFVHRLQQTCSLLTSATPILLLAGAFSPTVALLPFAIALGGAPLLLVISARLVTSPRYVSTVLGLHKAVEVSGAIIMQMVAGRWMRTASDESSLAGTRAVLVAIFGLNVVHLVALLVFARLAMAQSPGYQALEQDEIDLAAKEEPAQDDPAVVRRGHIAVYAVGALILIAWISALSVR